MDEQQRRKIIRIAALTLMQIDVPGAPAAAIGPPSHWWSDAEAIVDATEGYFREAFRCKCNGGVLDVPD